MQFKCDKSRCTYRIESANTPEKSYVAWHLNTVTLRRKDRTHSTVELLKWNNKFKPSLLEHAICLWKFVKRHRPASSTFRATRFKRLGNLKLFVYYGKSKIYLNHILHLPYTTRMMTEPTLVLSALKHCSDFH